jgi:pilus assembly protein CpaE
MVAETLDWPVESILPYDVHTTIAANQGRTIAEMYPDRPLSRAIVDLAVRVAGTPLPPLAPPGLMSRLTSIFR